MKNQKKMEGMLEFEARNEELQIKVSKTAARYVKRIVADSDALPHSGQRLEGQTTAAVIKNRLSNQVWDPGGRKPEVHDQEIMVNLNFGSLMQEHLDLASNVMEWSHVVANTILKEDLVVNLVLISIKCNKLRVA